MATLNQNLKNIIAEAGKLTQEINENAQNSVEVVEVDLASEVRPFLTSTMEVKIEEMISKLQNGEKFNGKIYTKVVNKNNGYYEIYVGGEKYSFNFTTWSDSKNDLLKGLQAIIKSTTSTKDKGFTPRNMEEYIHGFSMEGEC